MTTQSRDRSLLHIGCGYAMEWQAASTSQDTGFPKDIARIVLVDPNPACIEDLRPLARNDDRIQLIEAAVAQSAGHAAFHILTLEDFSCLCPPDRLTELMPGLTLERRIQVRCMTINDLLATADIAGADNQLVLETLSEETAILRDLVQSGTLDRFSSIAVRVARMPLQPDTLDPVSVALLLGTHGFVADATAAETDPDFPLLQFCRDPVLSSALTGRRIAEEAMAGAEADKQDLQTRLHALQAAHDAAQAAAARMAAALKEVQMALAASAEDLSKARDARAMVTDESARRFARIEALEAELAAAAMALAQECEALAKEKASVIRSEGLIRTVTTELEKLKAALDVAEKGQASALSDLGLALRMQQLLGEDLKDLKHRYSNLLTEKDQQDRLIAQLAMRLEEAAVHLQKPVLGSVLTDMLPLPTKRPSKKASKARKSHKAGKAGRRGDAGV